MANLTTVYRRSTDGGTETITVMAYIGGDAGDGDEIRVMRAIDGSETDDHIAYHPNTGTRWLSDQHAVWTAEGFDVMEA